MMMMMNKNSGCLMVHNITKTKQQTKMSPGCCFSAVWSVANCPVLLLAIGERPAVSSGGKF